MRYKYRAQENYVKLSYAVGLRDHRKENYQGFYIGIRLLVFNPRDHTLEMGKKTKKVNFVLANSKEKAVKAKRELAVNPLAGAMAKLKENIAQRAEKKEKISDDVSENEKTEPMFGDGEDVVGSGEPDTTHSKEKSVFDQIDIYGSNAHLLELSEEDQLEYVMKMSAETENKTLKKPIPGEGTSTAAAQREQTAQDALLAEMRQEMADIKARLAAHPLTLVELLKRGTATPLDIRETIENITSVFIRLLRMRESVLTCETVRLVKAVILSSVTKFAEEHAFQEDETFVCMVTEHEVSESGDDSGDGSSQAQKNGSEEKVAEHEGTDDDDDDASSGPTEHDKAEAQTVRETKEKEISGLVDDIATKKTEMDEVLFSRLLRNMFSSAMQKSSMDELSSSKGHPGLVSKIDVWGTEKVKGTSLHDWLQHVSLVLKAKGVDNEQERVKLAATYIRGKDANRWHQCEENLRTQGKEITWNLFVSTLQSQRAGVIPAEKARAYLLDFKVNQKDRPRTVCIKFQTFIDEVRLQEDSSRVILPDGKILIDSLIKAMGTWPAAYSYATQFHSEQLRKWDDEGREHPAIYNRLSTEKRWLQILEKLREAIASWDSAANILGAPQGTPKIVQQGKKHLEEQTKFKNSNGQPKRSRDDAPNANQPAQKRNTGFRTVEQIFNLSPQEYTNRKQARQCYGCGEQHPVFKCTRVTKDQKDEYSRLAGAAKSKNANNGKRN